MKSFKFSSTGASHCNYTKLKFSHHSFLKPEFHANEIFFMSVFCEAKINKILKGKSCHINIKSRHGGLAVEIVRKLSL